MIVAGIGSRKGVSEQQVLDAISATLAEHKIEASQLDAIATAQLKQHEEAIFSAGRKLGLEVLIVGDAELAEAGKSTSSHSELSLTLTGAPSVSEAAALAAAGENARLLGPRHVLASVTCALAQSGDAS
ncbi:cobalamin biosynthesis protein [Mesorhizobium sp. CGMCC 1.15528]|uniref:Cobalamin biosynthesis protein n=2 Tax=Mesorhizobium zhangyense TaxID=1776730 RepID=A0A7C9R5U9_9HYPH|nr:cobalamin biosynthesis protein [Mesorhizobium zhangyense]